jgi:polyhydroxyalkanoate synthesis repressor PhaR
MRVPESSDRLGSEVRIIKKYPNRRLYDTAISSYITLEDVRQLVLAHTDFCVRDAKTNEDITRTILLQIIVEREEGGEPIFSTDVLQQIIRFYGDALQGMMASYLDKSMKLFVRQQHALRQQMQNVVVRDPIAFMREVTEQNLSLWKEIQESFLGPHRVSRRRGSKPKARANEQTSEESES